MPAPACNRNKKCENVFAVLPEPTEIAIGTPLKQEVSDVIVETWRPLTCTISGHLSVQVDLFKQYEVTRGSPQVCILELPVIKPFTDVSLSHPQTNMTSHSNNTAYASSNLFARLTSKLVSYEHMYIRIWSYDVLCNSSYKHAEE